jgi:hypothetical protein
LLEYLVCTLRQRPDTASSHLNLWPGSFLSLNHTFGWEVGLP